MSARKIEALVAENLTISYKTKEGEKTILQDINVEIPMGKSVCIEGRSGCGKSSLLHALTLLQPPKRGEIHIHRKNENVSLSNLRFWERDRAFNQYFAYVFQKTQLLKRRSVKENIATPLISLGYPKQEIEKKVNKICEKLKITDLLNEDKYQTKNLSAGEAQRVGIARALITERPFLIADEICSALDEDNREIIFKTISSILQDSERKDAFGLILVSHNEHIKEQVDILLKIDNGKLITVRD